MTYKLLLTTKLETTTFGTYNSYVEAVNAFKDLIDYHDLTNTQITITKQELI